MTQTAEQLPIGEEFDSYLRTYNDATTWLAEVLDGYMRTPFEYMFNGRELIAEDGSELGTIFHDAIKDADRLATKQPELAFETRRRWLELQEYHAMLKMARGEAPNTMVVISDFPPELMRATKDVGGYNVGRKQTMLRVLTWHEGRLKMYSQSLDGSNRQALEAIYEQFGQSPEPGELLGQRIHADLSTDEQQLLVDRLTGAYDRSLTAQFGGNWYAGRREGRYDTYQFVLSQPELVGRFVNAELYGGISKQLKYNIAALMSERFEQSKQSAIFVNEPELALSSLVPNLDVQLHLAGSRAREAGKTFNGCGATSGPDSEQTAESQLQMAGYGNKSESSEDAKIPSIIKCIACKRPSPKEKVVREKSWRCPHCKYEVDICTGDVLHKSVQTKAKSRTT